MATDTTEPESDGFSAAEREAMKQRAAELRAEGRGGAKKADALQACLDRIASMEGTDRMLAERVHATVTEHAPDLAPKTWYGMPAYAREGKVVCFFQGADKFEARYATLGFNDAANLDEGNMWPVSFALVELTEAEEARIAGLVKRAVGES